MDTVFQNGVSSTPLTMPAGLQKGYVGANTVPGVWSYHSLVMEIANAIDAGVPLTSAARDPANVAQLANVITAIVTRLKAADSNLADVVPIGSIIPWIGYAPPTNCIIADGTEYPRTGAGSYPKLTDAILNNTKSKLQVFTKTVWINGYQGAFNTGNGSTTVGVPFLRSLVLKGSADGNSAFCDPVSAGRIVGQYQDQALLNHNHAIWGDGRRDAGYGVGRLPTCEQDYFEAWVNTEIAGNGPENLIRTMGVLWCIRAM